MIKLIYFGKKNELSSEEKKFISRISYKQKFEILALKQAGQTNGEIAKKIEAKEFFNHISSTDFLIAFDIKGKEMNSLSFAKKLRILCEDSKNILFVIGGAYGLSDEILTRANKIISVGPMTWTRNLFRLMALEQIYRAIEINGGGNFHK